MKEKLFVCSIACKKGVLNMREMKRGKEKITSILSGNNVSDRSRAHHSHRAQKSAGVER